MIVFDGIRDIDGKPLFTERDILDYIEEKCGWQVRHYVDKIIAENENLNIENDCY